MNKKIKVIQKEGEEIPTDILASEIEAISQGMRKLANGRLKKRALYLLIQDAAPPGSRLSIQVIHDVIDGIENLEKEFLK